MDFKLYKAEDFAADESFIRYFQQSDEQDVQFWQNWIRCNPDRLTEIITAETMLARLLGHIPQQELEAEQARMMAFLAQQPVEQPPVQPLNIPPAPRHMLRTVLAAAVLAGILIAAGLWLLSGRQRQYTPLQWTSFSSAPTQRTTIELPDGSTIQLNASTHIRYAQTAAKDSLIVALDGEAFFTIARNDKRIFIVQGGDMIVNVLGTSFNMSYYPESGKSRVALVNGKLKVVATSPEGIILVPNEAITYHAGQTTLSKATFDATTELGWRENKLYFDHADFPEIALQLKRLYNITCINRSKVVNMQYTGHFDNVGYKQVVASICYANDLRYTTANDTVFIQQ
ncbi:FecR family protein [Chitinophaga rhizophila]|uniref:FecR domain-containing protein n=1 Tax=Chitinophaga rhizophila TaxID=2866212 RepID=A0ABS7GLX7_9BACT|nr:FecR family protein [Chitinophaga rhizophila]MBW8688305.1 FecR domain-containing protein [Chitinophaga rhizophila]